MLKVKPMKLKPMPLVKKNFSLVKNDKDFDSLPDHLDCNPRNPWQQDNGSPRLLQPTAVVPYSSSLPVSRQQVVPYQREIYYIPPEPTSALPGETFPDVSGAIDAEYSETIPEENTSFYNQEAEELRRAQQAYQKAYPGKPYILFLLQRDGRWTRTPKKFKSPELDFREEKIIEEMLQNPLYVNFTLSQDEFFADRKNMRAEALQRAGQRVATYGSNLKEVFAQNIPRAPSGYARGPGEIPRMSLYGRKTPTQMLGSYSQQFVKPKMPDDVVLSYSDKLASQPIDTDFDNVPPGFQEQSPFPLHTPYRPIRLPFVPKPKRFPMFRPPFLR